MQSRVQGMHNLTPPTTGESAGQPRFEEKSAISPTEPDVCDSKQDRQIAAGILRALNQRDREVLMRFYAEGQKRGHVIAEMRLTVDEFCSIKARAKAEFWRLKSK